jgi:L-alanine-DL-glutamate epimerase-like enolase superfamily enzyme
MKITRIRTRVIEWRGKTVPLPPHFCTNPMDAVVPMLSAATMGTFTFHSWLIVEIFTDDGLVGIGNAALSPQITKQVIDLYLKPLLIGADPWDIEFLWQHMYRKTMAFGRKGIAMVAISAVDIALWDLLGKSARQPVYRLLGGRTKPRIPVYASRLYSTPLDELASESLRYKDEGYKAMKLRFGWGPTDGAAGMQKNIALVRTVRETVGGLTQARKIAALAEAHSIPVIPHAGQMHNFHVVMASFNSPMAEFFPPVSVEVGNELFWYCFKGEPMPVDGFIDLDENVPGLGVTVNEDALKDFEVIE